jgi:hypothetical protein
VVASGSSGTHSSGLPPRSGITKLTVVAHTKIEMAPKKSQQPQRGGGVGRPKQGCVGETREKLRRDVLDGPMTKSACLRDEETRRSQIEVWKQVGFKLNQKTHANGNPLDTKKLTKMKDEVQFKDNDGLEMCDLRISLRKSLCDGLKYGARWNWNLSWQICKGIEERKVLEATVSLEAVCDSTMSSQHGHV